VNIERVMDLFLQAQPARGDAWYVETLLKDRLFATRASDGAFGMFIAGEEADFGRLPKSSAISHESAVRIEPVGLKAPMLRIVAPSRTPGNRALVFLAYEAVRLLEENRNTSNEELLRRLMWMLVLLEDDSIVLSPERQRGLVGELQLLARLVRVCRARGASAHVALQNWRGSSSAKRDFAAPGIAVEVKTTSDATRVHTISSLDQLDPQDVAEEVFVYSLGVRHDYSAPRRLKHFVEDVEVLLEADEIDEYHRLLADYGFDATRPELYDTEPGISPFHLSPMFFREAALLRLRAESFVGGAPPATVLGISYRLLVTGEAVPPSEESAILDRLLRSPQ
jgi:hypothetical protein